MAKERKRIGILGGAFDPIHYGHLLIAENAAAQYDLDEVIFMPTGQSPHKAKEYVTVASHRCEMVRLAIADNPLFSLSRLEVDSKEIDYTYRTLETLKAQNPEQDYFFILGGDSLKDFQDWLHPKRILAAACVLAAVRDDMEGSEFKQQLARLNEWYGQERVFRMHTPKFSVSSHEIRRRISEGKTVRYMLPEDVRMYIMDQRLYEL